MNYIAKIRKRLCDFDNLTPHKEQNATERLKLGLALGNPQYHRVRFRVLPIEIQLSPRLSLFCKIFDRTTPNNTQQPEYFKLPVHGPCSCWRVGKKAYVTYPRIKLKVVREGQHKQPSTNVPQTLSEITEWWMLSTVDFLAVEPDCSWRWWWSSF